MACHCVTRKGNRGKTVKVHTCDVVMSVHINIWLVKQGLGPRRWLVDRMQKDGESV